jgi:hypothetical protein
MIGQLGSKGTFALFPCVCVWRRWGGGGCYSKMESGVGMEALTALNLNRKCCCIFCFFFMITRAAD